MTLLEPNAEWLPAYADALRAGWSPNTTRDVSGEELAAIAADPVAALDLIARKGTRRNADGTETPWLPGLVLWICDGAFCGSINLRYLPGTEELPPDVSGHIGYTVVPWRRGRGYAKAALGRMLPIAAALTGLPRVTVTCDTDNFASQAVIRANGGVLDLAASTSAKLHFQAALSSPDRAAAQA